MRGPRSSARSQRCASSMLAQSDRRLIIGLLAPLFPPWSGISHVLRRSKASLMLTNGLAVLNALDRINRIRPAEGCGMFQPAYGPGSTLYDTLTLHF
jgi:hypothetical protein